MIVGLLAMLFMIVAAFIVLARADRQTLKLEGRGERVEQAVQATQDVLVKQIGGRSGTDLVTGANYAEIPGYAGVDATSGKAWGAPWLSSPEAIHDPTDTGYDPNSYGYPAVTSLGTAAAVNQPLTGLMVNSDDTTPSSVFVQPGDPLNPIGLNGDTRLNAQQPFADADGDGIPDSSFADVAVATELANAVGGRSVRASGIDPATMSYIGDPNQVRSALGWAQFTQNARYTAAVRIKSHGGMVLAALDDPNDAAQILPFLTQMFNWVKDPDDTNILDPCDLNHQTMLRAMSGTREAVEPLLRRRGGLLVGRQEGQPVNGAAGVPPVLAWFDSQFNQTLVPVWNSAASPTYYKAENWQRFNLADLQEWNVWRQATTIDPQAYNTAFQIGNEASVTALYAPRQLITTANYSDELARIQQPKDLAMWPPLPIPRELGLRQGALKYYLGRITDANRGAFGANGQFLAPLGTQVILELANYFHELLRAHGDWKGTGTVREALTRRQQALSLAVNTVQFAAPHMSDGNIDTVWYEELVPPTTYRYYGYKPQPFFTQALAYNKPDPNDALNQARLAVAVELFNPYDPKPLYGGPQELVLSRYAITVGLTANESAPPMTKVVLDPASMGATWPIEMAARSFLVGAFWDGNLSNSNNYFQGKPEVNGVHRGLPIPHPAAGQSLWVHLWHWAPLLGGGWYMVDRIEVQPPVNNNVFPSRPVQPADHWYANRSRETAYEAYFGQTQGIPRWRMTVEFPSGTPNFDCPGDVYSSLSHPGPDTTALGAGNADSQSLAATIDGPCVPLYTMNANLVGVTLRGVTRPASFPTVGFMLYVPRFAHMEEVGTSQQPVSYLLHEQWDKRGYILDQAGNPAQFPPLDFGHMPVFDNSQNTETISGTPGFDLTGRVPWGQLVFDYFTTQDPNAVDPYHVPGRIDINTAPWFVLANLPVFGGVGNVASANLPVGSSVTGAAPAFWSAAAGILAGDGWPPSGVHRYLEPTTNSTTPGFIQGSADTNGEWYRLGPYLAQALAAYRDRTAYITINASDPYSVLANANWRDNPLRFPYRPLQYDNDPATNTPDPNSPRGMLDLSSVANPAAWKRGVLSIGELANVIGCDGSNTSQLGVPLDPSRTVLGGYDNSHTGPNLAGDFMKAVSLLALLDTHFLTTRSNTFTVYTTLLDRETPSASVSSVTTVDRSNLLPRLMWQDGTGIWANGVQDPPDPTDSTADRYTVIQNGGEPEILARREFPYYGARYDE
jgi:hypothetical protein